jgi:tetratricopeptide (TPR) repeat protein
MSTDRTVPGVPQEGGELSAILAAYLEAIDRGEKPDRAALLARHRRLADGLQAFFADQDRLDRIAEPLRVQGEAEATFLAYELLEEIGRGGMGVVLRCRDSALERDLAVKVLLDRYRDRPDLVHRFVDEARITGQLQHPFIVPVHELGTLPDGRPYFAMKLVQGRTLAELLDERGTPAQDQPRFLQIFEQICQTIAYTHSKGVIHRDLKPSNVMVGTFGEVQVMDWGLAKALNGATAEPNPGDVAPAIGAGTAAGAVLGTYAYMPPEQARGEIALVDRRSDVFGLGAILCEILTGSPPYRGENAEVRENARLGQLDDAISRLNQCGADAELIALARTCMSAQREHRPADGAAVAAAMARYFAAVGERLHSAEIARATAETAAVEERKRMVLAEAKAFAEEKRAHAERRRRRATVLTGLSLLLLLSVGSGFGLWYQQTRLTRETELATRRSVTERDVAAALAEVRLRHEEGLKHADNPERWKVSLIGANDALRRAENALALGEASDDLREEVAQARALLEQDERDRTLFATLEQRWLEATQLSHEDVRAPRNAALLFRAFRDYGLDLEALDPKEAAARIRAHPHRGRLMDEIEIVAHMQAALAAKPSDRTRQLTHQGAIVRVPDWNKAAHLVRILDEVEADPQAFGTRWRVARARQDRRMLVKMAQSVEAQKLSPRAVTSLASNLFSIQAFDEARALLIEVHRQHRGDFSLNILLGSATMAGFASGQGGSLDEAVRYLTAALAVRGNNVAAHVILSQVFKGQGKIDEAVRAAQEAVVADPTSAPALHNLGMLYYDRQEWDKALEYYHRAAKHDSVSALPHDGLGQTYAAKGEHAQAKTHYEIAIAREPGFAGVYVNLANTLSALGILDGAIERYDQALKLFPNYALAYGNKGHVLLKKNDVDGAARCFETAIECDRKHVPAHYSLGKLNLIYRRNAEAAIQCYQRAIDAYPQAPNGHFQMADLLQGLGRHLQAESYLRKLIELDSKYPEAHMRLGIALAARGAWDGAIAEYETALKQEDAKCDKRPAIHDHLGVALLNKGDYRRALANHTEALAIDAPTGRVSFNIAAVYVAQGDLEEAATALGKAIGHDKKNPLYHARLAKVLLEMRNFDKAIVSAERALAISDTFAEAYHVLADAQLERGEIAKAIETIRTAQAKVAPSDPLQPLLQVDYKVGQRYEQVDKILPAVLRGEAAPADTVESLTLAMICSVKHRRYATACRLFAEAFKERPALADNVVAGARFRAACCAARAAAGDAVDDAPLDSAAQTRLRREALDWLRADLDGWRTAMQSAPVAQQGTGRFRVRLWLTEPHLAGLREPERLKQLPDDERKAWTRLWADVEAFAKGITVANAGPDLDRLRKLAAFPSVATVFDIDYRSDKRDGRGNVIDPAKKIDELLPRLNGSLDDAHVCLELARYYGARKEKQKVREMAEKAEKLLRPFQNTAEPKEAHHLLAYARAHALIYPERWEEQEQWVRRATELAPEDWRARQRLGSCHLYRAQITLLEGRLPEEGAQSEALKVMLAGKATPKTLAAVETLLDKGRQCLNRARELAPDSVEQWEHRIGYLFGELDWISALRVARGNSPLPAAALAPLDPELAGRGFTGAKFTLEALPDLVSECREAAERCPDHVGMQVFGLLTVLSRIKQRLAEREFAKDPQAPLFLPREARFIDESLARIEQIRKQARPEAAPYFDRVLGAYHFQLAMLHDSVAHLPKAEFHVRRLVKADAKDQDARDILEFILAEQGRATAALEVAQERAAAAPTIRNRYMLARALDRSGQSAAAAKELDAALITAPRDLYCLAGRAVLLLHESDHQDGWAKAKKFADEAQLSLKPGERMDLRDDVEFIAAICQALNGSPVLGRVKLETLKARHLRESRYREAVQALAP